MKNDLCKWISKEKINFKLGFVFSIWMLISVLLERQLHIYYKLLYVFSFIGILTYILLNYRRDYIIKKSINGVLVGVLNIIIILDLYMYIRSSIIDWFLFLKILLYVLIIGINVHMVFVAKRKFRKKFIRYLELSIITVVISFAGIYSALYNMYFPYGYEIFKIDQKLNYSRVVMNSDFIYYSADCFFGRSVSYVKISTPDYTDVQDDKSVAHNHPEKFHNVELVYTAIRFFSMVEAMLLWFIFL